MFAPRGCLATDAVIGVGDDPTIHVQQYTNGTCHVFISFVKKFTVPGQKKFEDKTKGGQNQRRKHQESNIKKTQYFQQQRQRRTFVAQRICPRNTSKR